MKITVKEKSVYGNILLYPVCDTSKHFASLIGAKTFQQWHLNTIEAMGYEIEIIRL